MANDPNAHVEKMESAVMDVRTDKDKSQMKVELKPHKAETKPRDFNKVVLCGILCLSLCANVGSLAAFFASKETCVTGVALLKEGQEVPLNTTERRRLDEEECPSCLHYDPDYYYPTVCTRQPEPVLKKCAAAPTGTAEPCWELANPDMTDIPAYFLTENPDLTGTLKLGAAVRTIGTDAFYNTNLEGLDLSQAKSLVSIGNRAFENTEITGTLMIPDTVKTIADKAFYQRHSSRSKLTGLDLSNAASLESIGAYAFLYTDIKGTIVTPFAIPTYDAANSFHASFPAGVSIVSTIPGLKKCAAAPAGTEPCWELADGTKEHIKDYFLKENKDLTGTLKLGAAVRTIGADAFYYTNLEGLDLSQAESLVSIGNRAFGDTDITGTLMIPAKVETIGDYAFSKTEITGTLVIPANVETIGYGAFYKTNLEGLELSNADSLVSIANGAFDKTGIKGTLVIPAKVKTYAYSFPFGVTIVKG